MISRMFFCIVQREIRVGRTNDIFFAITKKNISQNCASEIRENKKFHHI